MAILRIYLVADWKSSPEYSTYDYHGTNRASIGKHHVEQDKRRYYVDIDDTWLIQLPDWAQRIGEEFSILALAVDCPVHQGLTSFGTAQCFSELFQSHEGTRGRIRVIGTNVHDVVKLYKMMCGLELVEMVPQRRTARRTTGIRTRPGWKRARTYLI